MHTQGSVGSAHIIADDSGNIYVSGTFMGTSEFDPGTDTLLYTSAGGSDIFIKKLDPFGNLVWAKRIGGTGNDGTGAIEIDSLHNVYLTGSFENTTDFDPGTGIFSASATVNDMYILKLDQNGNFAWMKQIGCSFEEYGTDVHISKSGILHVAGYHNALGCDLDPGPGVYTVSATTDSKIFYLKLDLNGNTLDIKNFDGTQYQQVRTIICDDDENIYLSGGYYEQMDFDPGPGVYNINNGGMFNSAQYIAKYTSTGQLVWAKTFKASNSIYSSSVKMDDQQNLLYCFNFTDSVDVDPGITDNYYQSGGLIDGMFLKLDSAGNILLYFQIGSSNNEYLTSADSDRDNNIYIAGSFSNTIDFDPGPGNYFLTDNGSSDIFIQKTDSNGNLIWAGRSGGTQTDFIGGLYVNDAGNIYCTGSFNGTADIDPDADSTYYLFNATPGNDAFDIKLVQCNLPVTDLNIISCGSYELNNYEYDSTGKYYQMQFDINGCDSVLFLDIQTIYIDTSVTRNGIQLTANNDSSTYQWVDCLNSFSVLPGANDSVFTPTQNGSYAVIINQSICSDTSSCYNVSGINVGENELNILIKLYPNPSTENISIEFPTVTNAIFEISDISGKKIAALNHHAKISTLNLSAFSPGMYFLKITFNGQSQVHKIIKQ
ncbi:MAG: T9SS type A sorting domain-containing protein [Bacteroidota bacterium]